MCDKLKAFQKEYSLKRAQLEKLDEEIFQYLQKCHAKIATFPKQKLHVWDGYHDVRAGNKKPIEGVILNSNKSDYYLDGDDGRYHYFIVEVDHKDGSSRGHVFIEDILKVV